MRQALELMVLFWIVNGRVDLASCNWSKIMPLPCVVLCENTLPLIQVDRVVFGATWNMPGRHGVSQVFPVPPVPGGLAGISLSEPLMRLLLRPLVYSWFCDLEIGLAPVLSCRGEGGVPVLAGAVLMRRAPRLCEGCGFLADGSNLKHRATRRSAWVWGR